MGLTGVVLDATVRLRPIETSRALVDTDRTDDLDDRMALHVRAATTTTSTPSRGWTCCRCGAAGPVGHHPGPLRRGRRAARRERRATRSPSTRSRWRACRRWSPPGCSTAGAIQAFNEAWYRKAPAAPARRDAVDPPLLPPARRGRRLEPALRRAGLPPVAVRRALRRRGRRSARVDRASAPAGADPDRRCSSASARPTPARCRSRSRAGPCRSTSPPASHGLAALLDALDERGRRGGRPASTWPRTPACGPSCCRRCTPGSTSGGRCGDRVDPDGVLQSDLGPPPRPLLIPVRDDQGLEEAGDGAGGLRQLGLGFVAALGDGIGDAVAQVLVEQPDGDALEALGRGRDLGQHVDAVAVVLDHLGDAPAPAPRSAAGGPGGRPCSSRSRPPRQDTPEGYGRQRGRGQRQRTV